MKIGNKQEDNDTIWLRAIVTFTLFQNFEIILLGIPLQDSNRLSFFIFQTPSRMEHGSFITQPLLCLVSFLGVLPSADPCSLPKPFAQRQKSTMDQPKEKQWWGCVTTQSRCWDVLSLRGHLCHMRNIFPINIYTGKGGKGRKGKKKRKNTFPGINKPYYYIPRSQNPLLIMLDR